MDLGQRGLPPRASLVMSAGGVVWRSATEILVWSAIGPNAIAILMRRLVLEGGRLRMARPAAVVESVVLASDLTWTSVWALSV